RAVRAARSSVTDRGSRWPPRLPCCRKSARPWAAEATRTSRSKAASSPAARPATGSRTQMSSWAAAASSGWRVLSRPALKAISNSARSSPAKRTYAAATAASCSRGSSLAARAAAQRRRCSAKLRAASEASSASRSAKCLYGAATLTPARRQAPASVKPCGPPSATSARAASSRASRRRPWCCPVVRRLMITRPRLTTFTCEEPEDRQSDAWHGRNEEPEDRRSGDPGVVEAGGRVADRRHESFVGGELRVERVQGAVHAVRQRPGRERGQLGRARVADRGAVAAQVADPGGQDDRRPLRHPARRALGPYHGEDPLRQLARAVRGDLGEPVADARVVEPFQQRLAVGLQAGGGLAEVRPGLRPPLRQPAAAG